jgi:hypothetical protein
MAENRQLCQEPTETETKPETMQSIWEHQEIPKEEAAVMPCGELRKLRRVRNLAAERRQKPKERTREYRGSWRRLIVAYRKMFRHATVTWRKRHIIRNNQTRTKIERATQRVGLLTKNLGMHHEGKRGTKHLGGRRPLYTTKKRTTAIDIRGWSSRQLSPLGRRGPACNSLKKTLQLKVMKRTYGMSSGFWKIKN